MEKVFGGLVPTLCVGMRHGRFASCSVRCPGRKASPMRSHAKRGNELFYLAVGQILLFQ